MSGGIREMTVDRFAGVDFSTDETKVDWNRSPDACNMIADGMYFPVKRTGYRKKANGGEHIYGLHRLGDDILYHTGRTLRRIETTSLDTVLYPHMNTAPSQSFVMGGKLWILDGQTYLVYDGATVKPVRDVAYVPTTTINAPPKGGGTSLEAVNLLTPRRINTFVGDGSTKKYHLDTGNIDPDSVTCSAGTIAEVDDVKGHVTFLDPPADGAGLANVVISFSVKQSASRSVIDSCCLCGLFGGQNDTRVFVTGNADKPNVDWQSGLYDPSYFPDTGYTQVGSDGSAIVGYLRQYDTQLVLKEDGQDAKQYLRTFSLDENGNAVYPLRQGAEAVGACGSYAHDVLNGTPIYLSPEGVKAIRGTFSSSYRSIQGVSARIDTRLLAEKGLETACACVWRKKWYLAVNGHCYVADGRQVENGVPEWYYWDNIPATCFLPMEDALWFGTDDGRICVFCNPGDTDAYLDDGAAIAAHWATPLSDLGDCTRNKTILAVRAYFKPLDNVGVTVSYRTDRDASAKLIKLAGILKTAPTHADTRLTLRRRVRDAGLFQVVVENKQKNRGFGLLGVAIRYQLRRGLRN